MAMYFFQFFFFLFFLRGKNTKDTRAFGGLKKKNIYSPSVIKTNIELNMKTKDFHFILVKFHVSKYIQKKISNTPANVPFKQITIEYYLS